MPDVAGSQPVSVPVTLPALDRFARLVARLLDAPMAGLTLVSGGRISVAAAWGVATLPESSPLAGSLTAQALATGAPVMVDADSEAAELAALGAASIAGVPLPGGKGMLWAADTQPRAWMGQHQTVLVEVADLLGVTRDDAAPGRREPISGDIGAFQWWMVSGDMHLTPALEEIYGLPRGRFGGSYADWAALVLPEDLPRAEAALHATLASGQPFEVRFRIRRPDGTVRWLLAYGLLFRDAQGQPERIAGINIDITDQRRIRRQHEREQRLRTAITDNATLALFLMDEHQHCTFMNPAAEQMTGYTLAEVQGRPLHDFVHHTYPDGRPYPLAECPIDRAFPTRRQEQGEEVFVHKDGHFYPVAFTASPLLEDGAATGTVIEVEDITARRAAEAARRETEERYRALIEVSPQLVWMSGPDGRFTFLNQYWVDFTGMTMAESLGDGWQRAIPADHWGRVEQERRAALATGEPFDIELPLRAAGGEHCWHLARGVPQRNEEGRIVRWIGVATNIDARIQFEQALQKLASASLRITAAGGLQETLQVITDEARTLIGARVAVTTVRGDDGPPSARAVATLTPGTPAPDGEDGLPFDRAVRLGGLLAAPLLRRDGLCLGHVQLSGKTVGQFTADDEAVLVQLAQVAAVAIENTRLFGEEQAARAAAEQAIRGKNELVSSISHDLKTPLTSIKGMAQLLRRQARAGALTPESVAARLDSIDTAAVKMTAMLDELLDVSRLEAGEPLTLQRNEYDLVARVGALVEVHRAAAPGHQWRFLAEIEEITAEVDGPRLDRVVDNLLSNAAKYTPAEGVITVTMAAEDGMAVISVEDTGAGIPAAALPRIFDRFYRAPNVSRRHAGLGLGLAGARQIVALHGGTITATSTEGSGSVFTVRLPRRAPATPLD